MAAVLAILSLAYAVSATDRAPLLVRRRHTTGKLGAYMVSFCLAVLAADALIELPDTVIFAERIMFYPGILLWILDREPPRPPRRKKKRSAKWAALVASWQRSPAVLR